VIGCRRIYTAAASLALDHALSFPVVLFALGNLGKDYETARPGVFGVTVFHSNVIANWSLNSPINETWQMYAYIQYIPLLPRSWNILRCEKR
jgi:hypothetical protein